MSQLSFTTLILFLSLFQISIASALTISRDQSGTALHFKGSELQKQSMPEDYDGDWISNDYTNFRPGCFMQTRSFKLPVKSSAVLDIGFEGYWRDYIDDALDVAKVKIARLDLTYENMAGETQLESHYILATDIGNFDRREQAENFVQIRAQSMGIRHIHVRDLQIPSAAKNVRVQVCAIAPRAKLRIDSIDLFLEAQEQSQLLSESVSAGPFSCFNTGLFLTNCQLEDTTLFAKNDVDLEYEVDLSFDCRGHDVDFALKTDESLTLITPAKRKQKLKVTGTELKLVDLNPKKTSRATFDLGCSLNIERVHKRLSTRAKRTFQNYVREVQLLTQILNDLRRVDSLTKDLTINMLQTNPQQLMWVAKTMKGTLDGIIERTEHVSEKSELEKIWAHLDLLTLDDKLASQAMLQKEIQKIQNLLKNTMNVRITSIFDRLDDIQIRIAGMTALLDANERREEEDLEEKINKAKKTFL